MTEAFDANKIAPEVEIIIGGKIRKMSLNFSAMVKIEKKTGKPVLGIDGLDFWGAKMSATDTVSILWACMSEHEDALKFEEVAKMISLSNFSEVQNAIAEMINRSNVSAVVAEKKSE